MFICQVPPQPQVKYREGMVHGVPKVNSPALPHTGVNYFGHLVRDCNACKRSKREIVKVKIWWMFE